MAVYFTYGEIELAYLRQKDKRLCAVIDRKLFEKIPPPLQLLLQRGKPVSVGGFQRRDPGNTGR